MERVAEAALFSLFCCQSLHWLEVEVVVQVKEVKIFPVDEQIEHVIALAANLQTCFDPIKLCQLEKLSLLEGSEKIALVLGFRSFMMQAVQDPALKELLVADSHFDRVALRAVLFEPRRDERYIASSPGSTRPLVVWRRSPVQIDAIRCIFSVQRLIGKHWLDSIRQAKLIQFFVRNTPILLILLTIRHHLFKIVRHFEIFKFFIGHAVFLHNYTIDLFELIIFVCWHWIDNWIVVEHWHIRVLVLDIAYSWTVIWAQMNAPRPTIV